MTTPAEEMRAAAKLLREMADDLGEWRYDEEWGFIRDGKRTRPVAEVGRRDAAWIALMGPDKAAVLASLLDVCAYTQSVYAGCSGLSHEMSPEQETALMFARSILASATPEES